MKTVLAVLALLSATLVSRLVGQGDDEYTRKTLVGLTGVYVSVEHIPDEMQRDGLDTTQIQTDVELKLRQAGITVLTRQEWLSTAAAPLLYFNVQAITNSNLYAFSVDVQLRQRVTLLDDPATPTHGPAHGGRHRAIRRDGSGELHTVAREQRGRLRLNANHCVRRPAGHWYWFLKHRPALVTDRVAQE